MWEGDPVIAAQRPQATMWQSAFPLDFLTARASAGDRLAASLSPAIAQWQAYTDDTFAAATTHHMLFSLPSFINHSAITNVSTVLIGSTMFVRAARDLQPGQELQAAYFDVTLPLQHRRATETILGFKDCCRRAALEDKAEVAALHEDMMDVYDALHSGCLSEEVLHQL
jgi:hypothetical protein